MLTRPPAVAAGEVAAWIWGIGIRRLVDALRRGRPRADELTEFAGVETSAEAHVLLAVQYGDVGAALASLSPELRAVVQAASRPDGRTRIREHLGYLPQDAGFHRGFTVFEFIDYVAILKEMTDRRARHDQVRRVITLNARRLWLRIGCAAAVVVPLWTAMLARYLPSAPATDRWALGLGLTVELAAALTVVWSVAAWGRRLGVEHPGIITTPALLASLLLAASISRAPMLVGTGPQWTSAHWRWSGVLVGAACVLMAGMRDPAARWRSTDHHT